MRRAPFLAAACAALLATACAERRLWETPSLPDNESSPILQDGAIYTPVAIGPQGCLLYGIEIPGGQAPAALVYRSGDGSFSYARPERCVEANDRR